MRNRRVFLFLLSLVVVAVLSACSSSSPKRPALAGAGDFTAERTALLRHELKKKGIDPWQLWSYHRLINNQPVKDKTLLQADQLHEKGELEKALKVYQQLQKKKLSPTERESVGVRVASTQLSLGMARQALSTVSNVYGGQQGNVDSVNISGAIILAYAYAEEKNLNQSLAWFVQVEKLGAGKAGHAELANEGVRNVLRKASNQDIDDLALVWSKEPLVGFLLGEERKLRARGAAPGEITDVTVNPYEEELSQNTVGVTEQAPMKIGLLLPLSGEYASLGKNVKEGIEIAVAANNPDNRIQIIEKDTGSDTSQVKELIESLALNDMVNIVVGPLLSSQAPLAAEEARLRAVPMLTFTKNSSFIPGGGVYRLGPTSSSQVQSLIEAITGLAGMTRLALVYPETAAGSEFAEAFRASLQARNMQPVFDRSYQPGQDSQLMSLAEEVALSDPEGVFFPDNINIAARFFMSIPEPAKDRISALGIASWDELRHLKNTAAALDGAIFPSVFFAQSEEAMLQNFRETYRAKYSKVPDLLAAQGFDAAMLVLAAAQNGVSDRSGLEGALRGIASYAGITGELSVSSSGEIDRKYKILIFSRAKLSELSQNETMLQELRKRRALFQPTQSGAADMFGIAHSN